MTETLSFPGLGLAFDISRVAFSIGDYHIYWYGITFALAFVAGILYFQLRAKKFGIHPYDGLDVLLWAVIGGVIGARAYFVVFQWDMYKDNLLQIFNVRAGGLAIYGGVIGALVAGFIACRAKKLPVAPMLDVGFTGLLLGQAIGRWGNFFNMEAFGCNTTVPWGMTSKTISNYLFTHAAELEAMGVYVDPTLPVHPTFFYESVWNLAGFLLLAFVLTPHRKYDGEIFLGYMSWYGLGRFFVEGLRTDSLMWGSIRVSQALGLALFIVSTLLLILFRVLRKREVPPAFLHIYAGSEVSQGRIAKVEQQMAEEKAAAREKKAKKRGESAPAQAEGPVEPEPESSAPESGTDVPPEDSAPEHGLQEPEDPQSKE